MEPLSRLLDESEDRLKRWRKEPSLYRAKGNPRRFNRLGTSLARSAKEAYENLLCEGRVVWGSLVQANVGIFQPGVNDLPATYIFSTEDYFKNNPNHLLEISNRIFKLKGAISGDTLIDATAERITDEYKDSCGYPIPYRLTEGHDVYMSSVFLFRSYLPERRLTSRILPLLVNVPHNGLALPLPLNFWSDQMIEWISSGAAQRSEIRMWETVWQTQESPEPFVPVFGGESQEEPNWIVDTPPVLISENAYSKLWWELLFFSLFSKAVRLVQNGNYFDMELGAPKRLGPAYYASVKIRGIRFYYPSGVLSEKEGVSIDFTDGPFQSGYYFRRVSS